jgi:hypothetical protein
MINFVKKVFYFQLSPYPMKKLLIIILFCSTSALAQKTQTNGTIYKEHPYIEIVKKLTKFYEKGDAGSMAKFYADTAHIYGMTRYDPDTKLLARNLMPKAKALVQAKAGWQDVINKT